MIIKESIHQEDTTILNLSLCSNRFKIYDAKTERTERSNKSTIIVGDFNTPLLLIDRTNTENMSQDT